jgi:phosphomevalonate kinase
MSRALMGASAPGKLMVSGEYAVLEGAVAVVASVNVRVYARWSLAATDTGEVAPTAARFLEAAATRKLAEAAARPVHGELSIDANELRRAGRKLGLGSSAAASVAAAGAVLATAGEDLSDACVQRRAFELALAGHKAIAPEGSGADVAAAALGGFVRFRIDGGQLAEAEPIAWPAQVITRVVWTGKEASTAAFVRAVRAFEARDPLAYGRIRAGLHEQAARFVAAIDAAELAEIPRAASSYGESMGALGQAAGVAIMTSELQQVAALAQSYGGGAKPSGAGGGDVAIAFFLGEADARAFEDACQEKGLEVLDLQLGAPGVRAEAGV